MEVSRDEALDLGKKGRLAALNERNAPSKFKLDIIENIPPGETISLYRNGDFIDLCAGPHVMRTGNIGAFKLTSVASAYYKGDEKNPQLQRIYGTAFKTKKELDDYFAMLEEAKKRDHRKLGKELEIFIFDDDVGPGLPMWLPRGAAIIEELEKLAKETEFAAGYHTGSHAAHCAGEVCTKRAAISPTTPSRCFRRCDLNRRRRRHLLRERQRFEELNAILEARTRNQETIIENLRSCENELFVDTDNYYLKAMNCPHHHKLFAALPRSYRDLPLRLAEYGTCYRYEQSGELFGLMRVRSMQMNDAHLYMTPDQFEAEFNAVNEMYLNYFKLFGIEKYLMRFSTHDPAKLGQKFVDEPELWKQDRRHDAQCFKEFGNQLRRSAERSRLLRTEDRRASLERDRPRIFHRDQSGRFRATAPVRPPLQRSR